MSQLKLNSGNGIIPSQAVSHIPYIPASLEGSSLKIGIVVARFNSLITESLLLGAYDTLLAHSVAASHIQVMWVPGAFELPLAAFQMAQSGKFDAVITMGCVIRGETTHYDYVCQAASDGVLKAGMQTGIPIIFGVVTTENVKQAEERSGIGSTENKGKDVALAAIEMANLASVLSASEKVSCNIS